MPDSPVKSFEEAGMSGVEAARYRRLRRLAEKVRKSNKREVPISGLGCSVYVAPGVFPPDLGEGTQLLLNVMERMEIKGKSILDMGTGTGTLEMESDQPDLTHIATLPECNVLENPHGQCILHCTLAHRPVSSRPA